MGAEDSLRDHVGCAYKDVQRMVAEERWKLIRYYHSDASNAGSDRIQLFDLASDPWETNDLSGDPEQAEHVQRLAGKLAAWQAWAGDPLAGAGPLPGDSEGGTWGIRASAGA
jgi:arylsulfatase A-like enzyme